MLLGWKNFFLLVFSVVSSRVHTRLLPAVFSCCGVQEEYLYWHVVVLAAGVQPRGVLPAPGGGGGPGQADVKGRHPTVHHLQTGPQHGPSGW